MNDLIARLIASGTPAGLVAEVAMELGRAQGERDALERRRASDRERQQAKRAADKVDCHVTSRDVTVVTNGDAIPPKNPPQTPHKITPVYNNPPTPQGGEVVDLAGKPIREPRKPRNREAEFVLPPQIPAEPWDGWVAMRTRIRKPLTEQAKRLAAEKLLGLVAKGHSAAEILNNSTMNGWQGLFEPTGKPAATGSGQWDALTKRRGCGP